MTSYMYMYMYTCMYLSYNISLAVATAVEAYMYIKYAKLDNNDVQSLTIEAMIYDTSKAFLGN